MAGAARAGVTALVTHLVRQELTTLQRDLPGLNGLEALAVWCKRAKQWP
jgi:hypothetical protein